MKKVLGLILSLTFCGTAFSQAGSLDPTFGADGTVSVAISSVDNEGDAVAIQSDGKIIVAGTSGPGNNLQMTVIRYNADGTMDSSFGENGFTVINPGNGQSFIKGASVQNDGKIVLAGYTWSSSFSGDFIVVRLNEDGSFDNSFGENGLVVVDSGMSEVSSSMEIQADGKILVAGDQNDKFAVARFNTDGSMDTDFGNEGWAVVQVGGVWSWARDITIQQDGKILLGGYSLDNGNRMAAVRLNTDGTPDGDFGNGGIVNFNVGQGNDFADGIAVQEDGKILLGGHKWVSNQPLRHDFVVVRLNTDGSFDSSYGTGGVASANIVNGGNYTASMTVQEDGKAIIAGNTEDEGDWDVAMVRFNTDGTLDSSFGDGGKVSTDIHGGPDVGNAVAVQADGRIVLVGTTVDDVPEFLVARYLGDSMGLEEADSHSIQIYPNPASNELNIKFADNKEYAVEIFDMTGRKVISTKAGNSSKINVANLSSGVYVIRIDHNGKVETMKFIKK